MKQSEQIDEGIAQSVTVKQIDSLYLNQPFALFSTVVVIALFFVLLSYYNDPVLYIPHLVIFNLVIAYRAVISWQYFSKIKNKHEIDFKLAESLYLIGVILTGTAWGYVVITLFPVIELRFQLLLFIIIMGVETAAHTTMGFRRAPIICFITLLSVPLLYAVIVTEFLNVVAITVAVILYTALVLRSAMNYYSSTYDMLYSNEILAQREQNLLIQTAKANSANMAKSDFLSRMSHELRTPLNAILGMNELMLHDKNEELTEKQRDRSLKVNEAGRHLLDIVDDVLDMSRIESGNIGINMQLTDCKSIVDESIKLIDEKAKKRGIQFRYEVTPSSVYAMADSKRLKQVIVNLLDNAVKYNKRGGSITILLELIEAEKVRISIVDTGYGISEDSIDDLYTPFSRLGAEKLGIDGTGIGLSLSKQLIEMMQGHIGVSSRQGKGCCFWIELPYTRKAESVEQELEQVSAPEHTVRGSGSSKVLLVEDNLVNCEVAVDMLSEMGYQVDVVNDGIQAVEVYDADRYNLILMDCEMPVMDGFTATMKIREDEGSSLHQVPIIALTAHAITGARDKCIASGMDDFLSKPFTMRSLQEMMSKWLPVESSQMNRQTEGRDPKSDAVGSTDELGPADVLDSDIVDRLCNRVKPDGSNLAEKVFSVYLEQSEKLLDDLSTARDASDIEAVKGISHALKSSSNNVGAVNLSALCARVEQDCASGQFEGELVDRIPLMYKDVRAALKDILLKECVVKV